MEVKFQNLAWTRAGEYKENMKILLVAVGSGLGGVLRYLVPGWIVASKGFPWATLTVNVAGSLLIGFLSGWLARQGGSSAESIRAFALVGFCGGFTTFSTFSNETFRLIESNQWFPASAYAGVSVVAGVVAVFAGHLISKGV